MSYTRLLLATALVLASAPARANTPVALCRDSLGEDRQPPFVPSLFSETSGVAFRADGSLQLDTNLTRLNAERIYFPFDQHVTISYVYESAGASHVLGYVYYDDMVARGYIDTKGTLNSLDDTLRDTNANGILDLHEDLFNVSPPTGPQARPYVGSSRRCNRTFTSGGFIYSEPELVANDGCGLTVESGGARLVGSGGSDRGLFPTIPNLLEPPHASNNRMGVGKLVFLLADDDDGRSIHNNLGPVPDAVDDARGGNGIPDYDVSAYDSTGQLRAVNPDPGISERDRTVDLGVIPGGKEVVFFIVVYYGDWRDVCLRLDESSGNCTLSLNSPINVYFSKSAWNLDLNPAGPNLVAERNIGCGYNDGCDRDNPNGSSSACQVGTTGQKLCGWLDTATLDRLRTPAYNGLNMPRERAQVLRSVTTPLRLPHVLVGAPSTDPFRWILGFEDLPTGGDRDFNDVVFTINKQNGGMARSSVVTTNIAPTLANDFTLTKVRFARFDNMAPGPGRGCSSPPCWFESVPGACSRGNVSPDIRYHLSVDCQLCGSGGCTLNPSPSWRRIQFPNTTPPTQEVEVDMLELGLVGSQLCWKAEIISPNEFCQPEVHNVNVGYQAIRGGLYTRASPMPLGNVAVWGASELPSVSWGNTPGKPAPSARALNNRLDFSPRGHLFLKSLYDPEQPDQTNVTERWNAGPVLAASSQPDSRRLYTLEPGGTFNRLEISRALDDEAGTSPLFPDSLCDETAGGQPLYDLNGDGVCGTPSHPTKTLQGSLNDRRFLRDWLYGWEDRYDPVPLNPKGGNQRRAWPLGAINLSTVALAIPPFPDAWYHSAPPAEKDAFNTNFLARLSERDSVAFVGTMQGMLHAFRMGRFRNAIRDQCTDALRYRGYFEPLSCTAGGSVSPRDYGSGEELFAYLPRALLGSYADGYLQRVSPVVRPQIDASPTLAHVDLGLNGRPAWTLAPDANPSAGAKTVLVSATGKGNPAVFSLDITDPSKPWYPLPMWEYLLQDAERDLAFSLALGQAVRDSQPRPDVPDGSGSRHAPSVGRLTWGTEKKWAAVVPTDYEPSPGRAGALYLLDMKTGRPFSYRGQTYAGVITLDAGFGVAAEAALVDINQDGTVDTLYVPSTAGNVWRINLHDIDTSRPLGQQVRRCVVARVPSDVARHSTSAVGQDQRYQQVHSNMAVRVVPRPSGSAVRLFLGTADSPDDALDGPPGGTASYRYHLLAYEDPDPLGREGCMALTPMWVVPLEPGQAVWGGMSLGGDKAFANSAVGRAADVCNLSQEVSGRFYALTQLPKENGSPTVESSPLVGHGLNTPVVHDQHLFISTVDGRVQVVGENRWNTTSGSGSQRSSKVIVWEPLPDGSLPKR
jgi:type IV pilus assembly protein PilY1